MINKAFIFDMDGVIVDSESAWIPHQDKFSSSLFGKKIYMEIGSTIGLSVDTIYQKAKAHGFNLSKTEYYRIYDEQAKIIYSEAKLMENLFKLLDFLKDNNVKIGLVTSSRTFWVNTVLEKHGLKNYFNTVVSLNDHPTLKPKPSSDGYEYAMKTLNSDPANVIILEDSNAGIEAGLNSLSHTIAYTGFLVPGYEQIKATSSATNADEIIAIVTKIFKLS